MQPNEATLSLYLADEGRTILFGEDLALALRAGDCLALHGDLGSGKSTLARAFIRAIADDPHLEVPSPTFTLVQSYRTRIPVAHFDLYRIGDPDELFELGLEEALEDGIVLIEWPEVAGDNLPATAVHLTLTHEGSGRAVTITGPERTLSRIRRVILIRDFLAENGHRDARRRFLTGDASFRAYETIHTESGIDRILMDWPRPPAGPPVLDGKSYAEVAHIATEPLPFIAVGKALHSMGFSTPEILAADRQNGILLLEDLGQNGVLDEAGRPIEDRYMESVACLARFHEQSFEPELHLDDGTAYRVPDFDPAAMKIEASLLPDWHLPWKRGGPIGKQEREDYFAIWDELIGILQSAERHLLLRDFHSPNILWLEGRKGTDRVGIIDFQDAMIGPTAYDVASLVQDARVTIESPLADRLLKHYLDLRTSPKFDESGFRTAFAIMAAQRNCKLAGIWVRLMQRDGKPQYMKHMPRTLSYLNEAFAHPVLHRLREWCLNAGMELPQS